MRDRGSMLILGVVIAVLFFGMAFAVVTLGVGNERDVRYSTFTGKALYLAETGISDSVAEIVSETDTGKDGVGTVSGSADGGTYNVTVTKKLSGEYDLVSTGNFSSYPYAVALTASPSLNGINPSGAVQLSGVQDERIKMDEKWNPNVRIDGGNHPALSIQDPEAYNELILDVQSAIDRNRLEPSVFSGWPTVKTTIEGGVTLDIPFEQLTEPTTDAELLEQLRVELYNDVMTDVALTANRTFLTSTTISANTTWGTPDAPQVSVVKAGTLTVASGQTLSGAGTLVVMGSLTLANNAKLDWDGDIIVLGDLADAKLTNDGAILDVDGSIILMESTSGKKAAFVTKHDSLEHRAQSTINGALLALNADSAKAAEIVVEKGGLLVNGLVVMSGQKNTLKTTDATSNLVINGSVQVAVMDGPSKTSSFKLELKGPTYITYNEDLVQTALSSLGRLPYKLNLPSKTSFTTYTTFAWRPVAPK